MKEISDKEKMRENMGNILASVSDRFEKGYRTFY